MTIHDNHLDQALEHVDQRRRGFLRNLLAGGAALVAVPAMSTYALGADAAAPAGKGGKGKGGAGGGKGKGGGAGGGAGGGKGKGGRG